MAGLAEDDNKSGGASSFLSPLGAPPAVVWLCPVSGCSKRQNSRPEPFVGALEFGFARQSFVICVQSKTDRHYWPARDFARQRRISRVGAKSGHLPQPDHLQNARNNEWFRAGPFGSKINDVRFQTASATPLTGGGSFALVRALANDASSLPFLMTDPSGTNREGFRF